MNCERCGRRMTPYADVRDGECRLRGDTDCLIHAAYVRGLREGVEVAKDNVAVGTLSNGNVVTDWTDVDAEIERRVK